MFDISSLLFSLTIVEIVLAAILLTFWATKFKASGLKEMVGATTVGGIGALLSGIGTSTTNYYSIFFGFVCFAVSVLLAARAMRLLQGFRPRYRMEIAAISVAVVAYYYFLVVENKISGALVCSSALFAIICGWAACDLLAEKRLGLRTGCRILGAMFGAFAGFQALKIIIRPQLGGGADMAGQIVLLDHVSAFVGMSVVICWSLGFLWTLYSSAEYQLRAALDELDRFSGAVAHDLKAPLSAVIGYLDAAKHFLPNADPVQTSHYISSAHEAALRMDEFIHEMLEHARSVQFNPAIEVVDTTKCLETAIEILRLQIDATEAKIDVTAMPSVKANSLQLTRVFQNLLDNALKYRSGDRLLEVEISAEQVDRSGCISIRDNGTGISEAAQTKIFADFERSNETSLVQGNGMGLWECRKILEKYGGSINVGSELGVGSTFIFILPAAIA